ncbi:MAG: hypothetical protein GY705_02205 [Bacteroidetes bacterium]|nr:hypothetical protein [Bacteroidota bacterium]
MKINLSKIVNTAVFISLVSVFLFSGCDKNDDPDKTLIYGTITFENVDTWQSWIDTGEVQVTIFPDFSLNPPAGWGEIPDGTLGPNVPGGTYPLGAPYNAQDPLVLTYVPGQTEYSYEIEVEPGTYSSLAVGFYHYFVQNANLRTATLGVHWDNQNTVSHGVVVKVDVGGGNIVAVHDYPAPVPIEIKDGEQLEINFQADFDFVNVWF